MINDFFNILLPQACLGLFILIELVLSIFVSNEKYNWARIISAIGISLSIVLLSTVQIEPQYFGFQNSIMSDNYTLLFHFVILLCGFFVVLLTRNLIYTAITRAEKIVIIVGDKATFYRMISNNFRFNRLTNLEELIRRAQNGTV